VGFLLDLFGGKSDRDGPDSRGPNIGVGFWHHAPRSTTVGLASNEPENSVGQSFLSVQLLSWAVGDCCTVPWGCARGFGCGEGARCGAWNHAPYRWFWRGVFAACGGCLRREYLGKSNSGWWDLWEAFSHSLRRAGL